MNIIEQIKKISQTYDIKPSRSKGQNFLVNPEIIDTIVSAAGIENDDTILEVGPGLGILTEGLIKKAKRIVAVELDEKIFDFLKAKFAGEKKLELARGDILKSFAGDLVSGPYKVVANIPYNITSILIKKFLTEKDKPSSMVLLVQKEVAQRICAQPGQMSLLAISVKLYGQPKIIDYVSKDNFWPKPEVDSAIIKIEAIKTNKEIIDFLAEISENNYWRLVKVGFSSKRKQLQHNLSAGLKITQDEAKNWLSGAGFDPKIRAQNLSVDDWLVLAKNGKKYFK